MKNLTNIQLNYKTKVFKLKDEFKISRISKKIVTVIEIRLEVDSISGLGECIPYPRYNERLDDILIYLKKNKSKIEKKLSKKNLTKIPFLSLQNALTAALLDIQLKKDKINFIKTYQVKKKFTTAITIPIFDLKKTKQILQKFKNTKIIKIKLDQSEVIQKLSLIRTICPKSQIIIDANESWDN